MGKVDLVVFDLDDTLLQTAVMEKHARQCAIAALGLDIDTDKALDVWRKLTWYISDSAIHIILRLIQLELFGESVATEDAVLLAMQEYDQRFWDELICNPYSFDILEKLKAQNIATAILSNGDPNHQMKKLKLSGLDAFFNKELIVIAEKGTQFYKPHPDGLLHLCKIKGSVASRCMYVGDRTIDMICANWAGFISVYLDGNSIERHEPTMYESTKLLKFEQPNYILGKLLDILRIL